MLPNAYARNVRFEVPQNKEKSCFGLGQSVFVLVFFLCLFLVVTNLSFQHFSTGVDDGDDDDFVINNYLLSLSLPMCSATQDLFAVHCSTVWIQLLHFVLFHII